MPLSDLSHDELAAVRAEQVLAYEALVGRGLKLDMTRGKPSSAQLDLSNELLTLPGEDTFRAADGVDCRNYSPPTGLYGLPELREIFAPLLNVPVDQLIAGDNASLAVMHDTLVFSLLKGTVDSYAPWSRGAVKFLCPVPGYDRHFALCEQFGIEMIPVDLGPHGPDLDEVRELVAEDPAVKGIWVVPTYANPNGAVYTEAVTRALLEMPVPPTRKMRPLLKVACVLTLLPLSGPEPKELVVATCPIGATMRRSLATKVDEELAAPTLTLPPRLYIVSKPALLTPEDLTVPLTEMSPRAARVTADAVVALPVPVTLPTAAVLRERMGTIK